MAGHHRSPLRGSSSEFAQHRAYVVGDELRRLDWKVFARTDRLVVKEFFEETTLDCHILVDASESMAFGSLAWTKFDYARWCAAALAHLVVAQRDTVGLVVFDAKERVKVPPASGEAQLNTIIAALQRARGEQTTAIGDVLHWIAGRLKRRGLLVVLSDFFDELAAVQAGIERLRHAGHEPILLQVVDPLELSFEIEHLVRFDGLEGLGSKRLDPRALRQAYREEFERHSQELGRKAQSLGLDFLRLDTAKPLDVALSAYLARRQAQLRAKGR